MGSLKSIKIKREAVDLGDGQSFDVRAVSTNDLMILVAEHGSTLGLLFGKLSSGAREPGSLTTDTVKQLIFDLAREFPGIAAEVIALASDAYDPEGIKLAGDLPLPSQVDAIEKVFRLTFSSEGDVKKFVESLTRMLVGVSGALTNAELPSLTGIGE